MSKSATLLWIPLRPFSNWRGEGIAGTIDGLVRQWTTSELYVVALEEHAKIINEGANQNVKFYSIPQIDKIFENYEHFIPHRIYRIITMPEKIINNFLYSIFCMYYFVLFRLSKKVNKVWCPSFATLFASSNFKKSKVINFWDGFVFEYYGFSQIQLPIYVRIQKYLSSADIVITQSFHNKSYLEQVLNIKKEKIIVLPNPNPSVRSKLDEKDFNTLKSNRTLVLDYWKCETSRNKTKQVADIRNRSILKRLIDESSKSTFLIFCSTQIRPYKGFKPLFSFLSTFQQKYPQLDFRLILTGNLETYLAHESIDEKTYNWIYANCYQISRVNNFNHALLYTIADLVVHPSYAEGGHGVYPLFEAASVDTPCIMNEGRHTRELLNETPQAIDNVIDVSNHELFEEKLVSIMKEPSYRDVLVNNIKLMTTDQETSYKRYLTVLTPD